MSYAENIGLLGLVGPEKEKKKYNCTKPPYLPVWLSNALLDRPKATLAGLTGVDPQSVLWARYCNARLNVAVVHIEDRHKRQPDVNELKNKLWELFVEQNDMRPEWYKLWDIEIHDNHSNRTVDFVGRFAKKELTEGRHGNR